jgi:hypothetical protein
MTVNFAMERDDPTRYCKIFVRGEGTRENLLDLVAEVVGVEAAERSSVVTRTLWIGVRKNDEFDVTCSGDFLFWPFLVEVQGNAHAEHHDLVRAIGHLLEGLWSAAFDAIAACDFEDELPHRGGLGRNCG